MSLACTENLEAENLISSSDCLRSNSDLSALPRRTKQGNPIQSRRIWLQHGIWLGGQRFVRGRLHEVVDCWLKSQGLLRGRIYREAFVGYPPNDLQQVCTAVHDCDDGVSMENFITATREVTIHGEKPVAEVLVCLRPCCVCAVIGRFCLSLWGFFSSEVYSWSRLW